MMTTDSTETPETTITSREMTSTVETSSDMTSYSGVTFYEALKILGEFGRYQKRVFILMSLLSMTTGIQTLITVFTLATPNFRCAIPELPNDTYSAGGTAHDELLNFSIPWETGDDGKPKRSECLLYRNRNHTSGGHLLANRSTVSCHRYVYDRSVFTDTFTEDANLVCDKNEYHAIADMLYMVGFLIGSIIVGFLSDRLGRKKALMCSLTVNVGCIIGIAFSRSFPEFATLRFFIGLSNAGVVLTSYVMGLEMVGDSVRTVVASVFQIFWPIGLLILVGVAYGVRDWRHLQLIMSCPAALFLSYFYFLTESPLWLASKGKYEEANAILRHAAEVNGLPPLPTIRASLETKIEVPTSTEDDKNISEETPLLASSRKEGNDDYVTEELTSESPLRMFTHRTTLIRTLIIFLNWVVVTLIYYGLSLNVGNIGGNIYLNFFLSSLAELFGDSLAMVGMDRLGRKVMHCISMILAGLACLATMVPVILDSESKNVIVLVLSNVGKLGASSAFSIIYLFSAELFPTVARNSLMGMSSMMARIGGIAAPYIAQLNVIVGGSLGVALPLVVFGGCGLLAGLMALLLPETLNHPLPATIKDAVNFGKKKAQKEHSRKASHVNDGFSSPP